MKIREILIVGGGSSGWMTAASLSRVLKGYNISLVESDKISTVGVGESTIILFNQILQLLDLKDNDWMKECKATYKNTIKFTDFKKKGHTFHYPFGGDRGHEVIQAWSNLASSYGLESESYAEFCGSHNYFLGKYNRQTYGNNQMLDFDFNSQTAYHFDAGLFGEYLKNNRCQDVTHYLDDIVGVKKDDDGWITSIVGEKQEYTADLYIDCTGFQSQILEKEMGSKMKSYKPWLSNDSAIATHIPYTHKEEQCTNATTCTAIENGWCWNIPLWDSIGCGYVYSSDFVDDETADKEFRRYLKKIGCMFPNKVETKKINIRHGVRERSWVKNVVGVGLSYGFVEPLESTSIVSTIVTIQRLTQALDLKDGVVNAFDRDGYNYSVEIEMTNHRDFVALHYKLTSRDDTPYWKYQQSRDWFAIDDSNFFKNYKQEGVALTGYEKMHYYHSTQNQWFCKGEGDGKYYIMAGFGYKPMGSGWMQADDKMKDLHRKFKQDVSQAENYVKTLPTSYEFLKKNIYA